MPLTEPTRLVLAKTYVGVDDPDAAAYIAAVEAADEAASPGVGALETATKVAIHSFVKGCKADGIWPAIKASCILAGARTLNGALVPLVGTAPTNYNFVAGDYDRKTGLVGDGSTKYLDSNRAGNADSQDNNHCSVYVHTAASGGNRVYAGDNSSTTGANNIGSTSTALFFRSRTANATAVIGAQSSTGLLGISRNQSSSFTYRYGGATTTSSVASDGVSTFNAFIFARSTPIAAFYSDGRLAFYSIGQSLDLALLDTRVTALVNALAAAIP